MSWNIENTLYDFIRSNLLFIDHLQEKRILKQNINSDTDDKIKYSIEQNPIINDTCMLSATRTFNNGELRTFTNYIKCPTVNEFNEFVNKHKDKIEKLEKQDSNKFSFVVNKSFINEFSEKAAITSYLVNNNTSQVFKSIDEIAKLNKEQSVVMAPNDFVFCFDINYNFLTINRFSLIGTSNTKIKILFKQIESDISSLRYYI